MALRIISPTDLDNTSETYLIAALQDSGAEHVTGNEWHFSREVLSSPEFVARVKGFMADAHRELADRLTVSIFRP